MFEQIENLIKKVDEYKPSLKENSTFREWIEFFKVRSPEDEPELWRIFEQWVFEQMGSVPMNALYGDPPEEMSFPTGIHLGKHPVKGDVYMAPIWLARNMLIVGETGSGKTNTLLWLAHQLKEHGVYAWIFDFKNEYQALETEGFQIIPWKELRLNPLNMLDPINVELNARVYQRIFGHVEGLWDASQSFLGERLSELYGAFGSFENKSFPSLHQLRDLVKATYVEKRSPEADYKARVLNRLTDMLLWNQGKIFACQRGFPIEKLVESNVVFQLRGLKDTTANLIAECLMASLYEYWVARGPQKRLQNVIISDEAKRLFNVRLQARLPDIQPYVDYIMAETRAFGIGVLLADHQSTELTGSVAANSHIKLIMQLSSGKDISDMVLSAGLNERQMREAYRLSTGEAIVKVSGNEPFKVKIPLFRQRFGL